MHSDMGVTVLKLGERTVGRQQGDPGSMATASITEWQAGKTGAVNPTR